jgi:hypothetical protein
MDASTELERVKLLDMLIVDVRDGEIDREWETDSLGVHVELSDASSDSEGVIDRDGDASWVGLPNVKDGDKLFVDEGDKDHVDDPVIDKEPVSV